MTLRVTLDAHSQPTIRAHTALSYYCLQTFLGEDTLSLGYLSIIRIRENVTHITGKKVGFDS